MKNKGCLAVLGYWRSGVRKNFDFYCKTHIYTWIHVVCDIPRENGLGCDLQVHSGKKIKKVTNIVYFTYLPRSPRCSDRYQICSGADIQDVINCAKFYSNPFRGFDFVGGRINHRNEVSPLTQGLSYRSACDLFSKCHIQCVSKKSPLRFSDIFSQTVGNF